MKRSAVDEELDFVEAVFSHAVWKIRRFTSYAYLHRWQELSATFLAGLKDWARRHPSERVAWMREILGDLSGMHAKLERGLSGLEKGERAAMQLIAAATNVSEYLTDRRLYEREFADFGWREEGSVGLFSWMERALRMACKTKITLTVPIGFERKLWTYRELYFLDGAPCAGIPPHDFRLSPEPVPEAPVIRSGESCPIQGVWVALDAPNVCPTYIIAGIPVPRARVAYLHHPGESPPFEYIYKYVPMRWGLVWEEDRYLPEKALPDESYYLGPDTEFPTNPPYAE